MNETNAYCFLHDPCWSQFSVMLKSGKDEELPLIVVIDIFDFSNDLYIFFSRSKHLITVLLSLNSYMVYLVGEKCLVFQWCSFLLFVK